MKSDTNEATTATPDNAGLTRFRCCARADYKVTSTRRVQAVHRDKVTLEAAKVAGVDINLEVGGVNETVEVTAAAATLETQSASRGGVVTTSRSRRCR